ncbi:DNA topoisomerase I [Candidatus Woesearchaeota archaeon]|nr:DNA topoisomerase I [Candidatus Woesearchaeota archaeon]
MYELIITEKPKASLRIAEALADTKPKKESHNKVPYYKLKHKKKEIVVACAVGHLYTLDEKKKKGYDYPTFDIEWQPSYKKSKESKFTKKYLDVLKKLSKDADKFTIACDYDVEGEVIGLNVLRYACKQKDARRMKFSTLTKPDIIKAYDNVHKTIEWGQAEAGETRHFLDYYYGINLSRALISSIKSIGKFKILSSGRVQGPSLKIVVEKEKEIRAFDPVQFWQINLLGDVDNGSLEAWHEKDKFWEKDEAEKIFEKVKNSDKGKVADVKKTEFTQTPPTPFDLTTLQTEAYRVFKISPKETLSIAQELYTNGLISYPRTSSQILPEAIGYKQIMEELMKQDFYKELVQKLLSQELTPNNGKKTDPAHPAIYPTGIIRDIDGREARIYDLIVRRFMATFGKPATRETMQINIDVNEEIFISKGTRTKEKGWHVYYGKYVKLEEEELPGVSKDEEVRVKETNMLQKETQPPKRYTQASIIKELEKRNLGTKSTRAQIIDTLYRRGYVTGTALEATELGIKTVETLEKYSPRILDEELTKHFELEMNEIREKKKKGKDVLKEAKEVLTEVLKNFKKKEKKIGKALMEAEFETRRISSTLGKCVNCEEGELTLRKGKFGRFIACNKYPDCKTTFSIPNTGAVHTSKKSCNECDHPMITITRGKRTQRVCINPECPSKQNHDEETKKEIEDIEQGNVEKKCPKCDGNLIIRKSVYGSFYGCSKYPKCRHTEKLNGTKDSKKE